MLLDSWIPSSLIKGNSVLGIEVVIADENEFSFNFVKLKKEGKSEFAIEMQLNDLSVEELVKNLKLNSTPIILSFSGKKIPFKRCDFSATLKDAFPDIPVNELYYQSIEKGSDYTYWSIIRKDIADRIVNLFNDFKSQIVATYIGPAFILKVTDFVELNENVQSHCYHIVSQNDSINFKSEFTESNEQLDLINFKVNNKSVIATLSALYYFLNQSENISVSQNTVYEEKQYFENKKFKLAGYFMISLTLFLCLLNLLLFNSFFNENKELKSKIEEIQSSDNNADNEIAKFKQQQAIFKEIGLVNKNNYAFIADKIAATVKPDITLMTLDINPLKKQDSDTTISFEKELIVIKGKCEKSISVNEWLNDIKKIDLVKDAKLDKFNSNNTEQGSNFEISLQMNQ